MAEKSDIKRGTDWPAMAVRHLAGESVEAIAEAAGVQLDHARRAIKSELETGALFEPARLARRLDRFFASALMDLEGGDPVRAEKYARAMSAILKTAKEREAAMEPSDRKIMDGPEEVESPKRALERYLDRLATSLGQDPIARLDDGRGSEALQSGLALPGERRPDRA